MTTTHELEKLLVLSKYIKEKVTNVQGTTRDMDAALDALEFNAMWLTDLLVTELAERKTAKDQKDLEELLAYYLENEHPRVL